MPILKVNAIEMYYSISGNGFPVVLIHGVTISSILWDLQVPTFSKHYKIINLDLRNHGKTSKIDMEITMELLADDVKALLDALNINEACIIGESMGCFVSMEFALKYPEVTKFLILTCGAAADNTHVGATMLLDSWIEHFKEGGQMFYQKDVPLIACKYCRNIEAAKGIFEKYQKMLRTYPQNPIIRVFEGIKKFNARDRLKQISCPTLIIHGKRDKLIPLPFVQETHELIKDSKLEILNGCHFALVHEHERFNEIILNFLKSHGG